MRASNSPWVHLGVLLGLLALPFVAACHKEVKADFPRPPATATMTPPATAEPPAEPEPESAEPPPPSESGVGAESGHPEPPSAAPPRPHPKPKPDVAAEPPAQEQEPPPSTQLAQGDEAELDPQLSRKLEQASLLLGSISGRSLNPALTEQLTAARAFVAQARQALLDGDERRALVLIDKGLILAQDVERLSRP